MYIIEEFCFIMVVNFLEIGGHGLIFLAFSFYKFMEVKS